MFSVRRRCRCRCAAAIARSPPPSSALRWIPTKSSTTTTIATTTRGRMPNVVVASFASSTATNGAGASASPPSPSHASAGSAMLLLVACGPLAKNATMSESNTTNATTTSTHLSCCMCESIVRRRRGAAVGGVVVVRSNDDDVDGTGTSSSSLSTTMRGWHAGVGLALSVLRRGIEIVLRLSPLLVLVPTSMIASYAIDATYRHLSSRRRSRRILAPDDDDASADYDGEGGMDDGPNVGGVCAYRSRAPRSSHPSYRIAKMRWKDRYHPSEIAWTYGLHALQSLGPAFVKLGQWAGTRRDLFPNRACDRLSLLHDATYVHDWQCTHEALVNSFGADYESRGLVVTGNATNGDGDGDGGMRRGILGSGCVAQVHEGTLHARSVAIKVLHPNTRWLVERDLNMMRHIATFVDKFFPFESIRMLSLPRAISTFANVMERQVDLRIERDNLMKFRKNFGCSSSPPSRASYDDEDDGRVAFPRPENGWVTERVLVEEHVGLDALPISCYLMDDSPEGSRRRKEIARPLLLAFLKMVFIDNFIHADLHPGNVLVRASSKNSNPREEKYTIIFLDAGLATSLEPNDRKNLCDLFRAIVLNDGYIAGELMVERARYERCTSIPGGKHAFASGVSHIVSEFHDRRKQGLTLGAVRVGALLGQVLDLCRRHRVEIDPAMSSVVVSMLVLEGLGRSLDPDLNLIKAAMPFLLTTALASSDF